MTRPEEFTVYQATDPGTAPEILEQMAGARPDLRQFVAANPSTAPEVLAWLGDLGDPGVAAALARRSGQGTSWTAPAHGSPAPPPEHPPAGGNPYASPAHPAPNPYAPPGQQGPNPYAPPATHPAGPAAPYPPGGPGAPAAAPYGAPPPYGQVPYGSPSGQPGQDSYPGPYASAPAGAYAPPTGDPAAPGYGYQPQPGGSRKGLVAAIVVGAVVLVGALVFAATQIFGSLGGGDFGDDPDLDRLWNACAAGDPDACDDLYMESPLGSEYEEFGDTCGQREPSGHGAWCRDVM